MPIVAVLIWSFLSIIVLYLLFWRLIFLRDPVRDVPPGKNLVSPADGTVMDVLDWTKSTKVIDKKFVGRLTLLCGNVAAHCKIVTIFMSPLNVHVNRIPYDGKIVYLKHFPGSFAAANRFDLKNERNELILETSLGKVKVVQVAGFLARRIECWVNLNEKVVKGQRFGRINLGSQVILVFPASFKVLVAPGQRVFAGSTIIARP